MTENKLIMKRTRATARIQPENKIEKDDNEEDMVAKTQAPVCLCFKRYLPRIRAISSVHSILIFFY